MLPNEQKDFLLKIIEQAEFKKVIESVFSINLLECEKEKIDKLIKQYKFAEIEEEDLEDVTANILEYLVELKEKKQQKTNEEKLKEYVDETFPDTSPLHDLALSIASNCEDIFGCDFDGKDNGSRYVYPKFEFEDKPLAFGQSKKARSKQNRHPINEVVVMQYN